LMEANGQTDRQTDRQTDMTKLIVAFRNFANAPKRVFDVSVSPNAHTHRYPTHRKYNSIITLERRKSAVLFYPTHPDF
jgi:hypothetical protein